MTDDVKTPAELASSTTPRTWAQTAQDAIERLAQRAREPTTRKAIRYVVGSVVALYLLWFAYFAVILRPTRDVTYRAFNGLPRLVHGGDAPIAGIEAPNRQDRAPRWWWFVAVGWWAGLLWLSAAWFPLLVPSTVPVAMSMLAATDAVLFLPRQRVPKRIIVQPPEPVGDGGHVQERVPIPRSVRFRVLDRDGYRCRYCGRSALDGAKLHIDHIMPVARGGTNEESNLVTACQECNLGKGTRRVTSEIPRAV